ncbi:MAG: glutamate--tRNA ligase family protein [Verrucomicrobiota bacterium]|nr:glutamate--tRNA ligase family protein [Verrucomicrobiota bacterium]
MSTVRVRFAPSPTGFFHIGSARTALFNWLYARHTGGTFILRIEDTDKERNTEEALRVLEDGMHWLGLDWDEGPGVGGPCGPYFQSQRMDVYRTYLQKLVDAGRAYEKDGAFYFKNLGERYQWFDPFRKAEVEKVRVEPTVLNDAVLGRMEKLTDEDFVIFRANGEPIFHFVNVVDDIAMGITHVIRGADHKDNTFKHIELFKAFGAPLPVFAHIPLILKTSGSGKMSKRDQGALIEEYQQRGYLPAAIRNFLCMLGWNPKNNQEVMPIEDIIALFDFPGINKDNARFDEKKLAFFNTEYLRRLPIGSYAFMAAPLLQKAGIINEKTDETYLQTVLALCQEKMRALEDLPGYVGYFFKDDYAEDPKAREKVFKGTPEPLVRLREWRTSLDAFSGEWTDAALEALLQQTAATNGRQTAEYIHITRLAISGSNVGPSFYGLLRVLGRERVLARMERFLAANNG